MSRAQLRITCSLAAVSLIVTLLAASNPGVDMALAGLLEPVSGTLSALGEIWDGVQTDFRYFERHPGALAHALIHGSGGVR